MFTSRLYRSLRFRADHFLDTNPDLHRLYGRRISASIHSQLSSLDTPSNCTLVTSYSNQRVPFSIFQAQNQVLTNLVKNNKSIHWYPFRLKSRAMHYQFIDAITSVAFQRYSNLVILDVDCVPLSLSALTHLIQSSFRGSFIGVEQYSSHTSCSDQPYISPVACAFNRNTFLNLGSPSAVQTPSGDVLQSFTNEALHLGLSVDIIPIIDHLGDKRWVTPDGRSYGIGTRYGYSIHNPLFYHNFCSSNQSLNQTDNISQFLKLCNTLSLIAPKHDEVPSKDHTS